MSQEMKRQEGGNEGAHREGEPVRTVADRMEWRVNGVNSVISIYEVGSQRG